MFGFLPLFRFYNWDSNDRMYDRRVSRSRCRRLAAQDAPEASWSAAGSANRPQRNHWIMWDLYIWPSVHVAARVGRDAPNKENKWLRCIQFFCTSPRPPPLQKLFTQHASVIQSGWCSLVSSFMHVPSLVPSLSICLWYVYVQVSLKLCILHEPFTQPPVGRLRSGRRSRGWAEGGRTLAARCSWYSC